MILAPVLGILRPGIQQKRTILCRKMTRRLKTLILRPGNEFSGDTSRDSLPGNWYSSGDSGKDSLPGDGNSDCAQEADALGQGGTGSENILEICHSTKPRVATLTVKWSCRRRTHSERVAPVVRTSSTSSRCRTPEALRRATASGFTAKAPRMFCRRDEAPRRVCVEVYRTRRSKRVSTGRVRGVADVSSEDVSPDVLAAAARSAVSQAAGLSSPALPVPSLSATPRAIISA